MDKTETEHKRQSLALSPTLQTYYLNEARQLIQQAKKEFLANLKGISPIQEAEFKIHPSPEAGSNIAMPLIMIPEKVTPCSEETKKKLDAYFKIRDEIIQGNDPTNSRTATASAAAVTVVKPLTRKQQRRLAKKKKKRQPKSNPSFRNVLQTKLKRIDLEFDKINNEFENHIFRHTLAPELIYLMNRQLSSLEHNVEVAIAVELVKKSIYFINRLNTEMNSPHRDQRQKDLIWPQLLLLLTDTIKWTDRYQLTIFENDNESFDFISFRRECLEQLINLSDIHLPNVYHRTCALPFYTQSDKHTNFSTHYLLFHQSFYALFLMAQSIYQGIERHVDLSLLFEMQRKWISLFYNFSLEIDWPGKDLIFNALMHACQSFEGHLIPDPNNMPVLTSEQQRYFNSIQFTKLSSQMHKNSPLLFKEAMRQQRGVTFSEVEKLNGLIPNESDRMRFFKSLRERQEQYDIFIQKLFQQQKQLEEEDITLEAAEALIAEAAALKSSMNDAAFIRMIQPFPDFYMIHRNRQTELGTHLTLFKNTLAAYKSKLETTAKLKEDADAQATKEANDKAAKEAAFRRQQERYQLRQYHQHQSKLNAQAAADHANTTSAITKPAHLTTHADAIQQYNFATQVDVGHGARYTLLKELYTAAIGSQLLKPALYYKVLIDLIQNCIGYGFILTSQKEQYIFEQQLALKQLSDKPTTRFDIPLQEKISEIDDIIATLSRLAQHQDVLAVCPCVDAIVANLSADIALLKGSIAKCEYKLLHSLNFHTKVQLTQIAEQNAQLPPRIAICQQIGEHYKAAYESYDSACKLLMPFKIGDQLPPEYTLLPDILVKTREDILIKIEQFLQFTTEFKESCEQQVLERERWRESVRNNPSLKRRLRRQRKKRGVDSEKALIGQLAEKEWVVLKQATWQAIPNDLADWAETQTRANQATPRP